MKIAMLNCLKSNKVCTGAACLSAMNSRSRSFEPYQDTPLELVAMARCNGWNVWSRRGPKLCIWGNVPSGKTAPSAP